MDEFTQDKYRFWTGVTLMVRLIVTVLLSSPDIFLYKEDSGRLAVVNACIITIGVVGIFTVWSFTKGVIRHFSATHLKSLSSQPASFEQLLVSHFFFTVTELSNSNHCLICLTIIIFLAP